MIYYQFDSITGEYIGESIPVIDPLETKAAGQIVYALPGASETAIAPPAVSAGQVAVFEAGNWTVYPDYRGATWYDVEGMPVIVDQVGEPVGLQSEPPPSFIARLKAERIQEAWSAGEQHLANYVVTVSIDGAPKSFGCDIITRENIIGINELITKEYLGLLPSGTIPNPRPWTPKGAATPISVSHTEFAAIGAAIAAAKEAHYQVYASHKAAVSALTTVEAIVTYDVTIGWPT